jgi:predicted ATPase
MVVLPSGTVTFLFTDLEGSTRLLSELGAAAYGEALAEHRGLVRSAVASHHGVEVDTQGDAFFVVFTRAADALGAGAAIADGSSDDHLRVRVGIHTGEPLLLEQGYVGMDVHRAARIAAAGHGDQVLVSQTTRDLVPDLRLRDLGEHRLKDLARPERLFQLGEREFPPLRSLYRTNLPIPSWPLIGREQELAEIERLVESGRRLVTLTGPGGSGKTRLAVQAAAELADSFPGGVFFVALAPLQRTDAVPGAVATALGLRADTDLVEALRSGRTLLVLDNAEHLQGVERLVADLIERAVSAVVVVTSRAPLHLGAEAEFPVDPLASDAACELFVARAAAAGRTLAVDDEIRAVCARVDDLPLAVELAAARTKTLSPTALLERLEHALPLLTGGPRDAPERQQTLHATIEWSYRLLDDDARAVFRRLAVFRGGFSLPGAEQVTGADLDQIADLVEHSLLKAADDRFLMLETLREFALEQFSRDELAAYRAAHADYYRALAEREAPFLESSAEHEALDRLGQELPNLRAALDWMIESRDKDQLVRMVAAPWRLWLNLGLFRDGKRYAMEALALAKDAPEEIRVDLLRIGFWACFNLGEWDEAERFAQQRIEIARAAGDPARLCEALTSVGAVLHAKGELGSARTLGIEALALARQLDDARTLPGALHNHAVTEWLLGEYEDADAHLSEALELWRVAGSRRQLAHARHNLAQVRVGQDRLDDADALFRQALPDLLTADKNVFAWALAGMSHLAWHHGDTARAARLLARSEALHREIAYVPPAAYLAIYEQSRNDLHQARTSLAVEAAWLEGEAMSPEDVLDYALQASAPHLASVPIE